MQLQRRTHIKTHFRTESFRLRAEKGLMGGSIVTAMLTTSNTFAGRKLEFAGENGGLR